MNSFGKLFQISIYGESHGEGVGIIIDGCPPGIDIKDGDFEKDLLRRKSGKKGTTPRKEPDIPQILSGIFNNKTTGSPINIFFQNTNTKSKDYSEFAKKPRPGHADFTGMQKFGGFNDMRGGGHFSGRLTLGLVAAGTIAKKIINPIIVESSIIEIGGKTDIEKAIDEAVQINDSVGGIIKCKIDNVPVGLGEPFFDSVESLISHMIFAIPATKGIEFGAGFEAAKMKGSEHNDTIINVNGKTKTNNAGGINGGITNGNSVEFNVAIKPTSSISVPQQTINLETEKVETLTVKGRHDACIALRIPPVIEAAAAIVFADLLIQQKRV